ncbi:hypothetical protein LCGC14_0862390 [marine sediment metagenome]|uniref:Uncharacterized protein n=1 Tax=marine sediment metagenome TaxID=412755 RepID=A0A0F9RRM5_9ZZZZ
MAREIPQTFKNVTVSATGLRRMANALQKSRNTKGDTIVEARIETWKDKNKIMKTIGIII